MGCNWETVEILEKMKKDLKLINKKLDKLLKN